MDEVIIKKQTFNENETYQLGKEFAEILNDNDVVALYGDLGAGKTVIVRGIVDGLTSDVYVHSPTYTIVNDYSDNFERRKIYHFDMYRIDDEDSLYSIGFDDYLSNGILLIEWSEKINYALPSNYYKITINKINDTSRMITAERVGNP